MAQASRRAIASPDGLQSTEVLDTGISSRYDTGGGPLFTNSVVTGNTLIWHSNGPKPQTVFDWFSNIKYWLHHENMCRDLHSNTGTWLLNRDEFLKWKSTSKSSILWLHGIPGCGKSKLVAHVINHMSPLMDTSAGSFAYFYCIRDAAEDERSRPEEVIHSILRQISFTGANQKVMKEPAAEVYQLQNEKAMEHGSNNVERLTLQQSIQLLISLLDGSSTVIIIDAIDELKDEERWRFFEAFDEILAGIHDGSLRLFVSSRDNGDIKMKLSQYTNVYIKATDNQDDIQRFVKVEVDKAIACHRLLRGAVPSWLKAEIVTTLVNGAQGMFRWVSLQIQALCSPNMKTARSVKTALKALPKTLEESYDVVYQQMLDLDLDARVTAQNAVRWLLCAKRPLRSLELMAALTISKVEEASPLPEEEPRSAIEELLDICCNLIVLDDSVDAFRMAHLSVREYFEQKCGFDKITINSLAVASCIDTLMVSCRIDEGFFDFDFYATIYWPEHCQEISVDGPHGALADKMNLFLFENGKASIFFEQWARRTHDGVNRWPNLKRAQWRRLVDSSTLPPTPQFVASSYGLSWILKEMVKRMSLDRDRRVQCGDTGFNLACIWGYRSVVEEFLNAGADVGVPGNDGRTPLIIAAEHGHRDLVRFLLSKNANINTTWAQGRTPLHEAVHWGQYEIAKILLDSGADIEQCDIYGVSPLIKSIQRDRTFVPGVFFDGANAIEPGKKDNSTGLFYSGEMMRLLVDHGADLLNPANKIALHEAVRCSNVNAIKMLAEAGVDVNYADSGGVRPLDNALEVGLCDAVGILLAHSAIPGLKWEKTTYHVCQWKKEVWYPQLIQALDLCQGKSPAPFIPMPETTETRISREDSVVITMNSPDIPYIWIRVPPNMTSVNSVKFTTDSHDQGWSDNAARLRGTYEQSYTWFEAGFLCSSRRGLPRRSIQCNIHGSTQFHTHVNVWNAQDPDPEIRELLALLKPGDSVQVYSQAKFPGWANFVRRVEIEIQGVTALTLPRRPTLPKL